jgi:ABC-type bacteriocin/lantibiotic exporter with double-glycine peptidase domain
LILPYCQQASQLFRFCRRDSLISSMMRLAFLAALAALCFAQTAAPWLDVPYVEQVRAGCGSAAVAMVVQYWAHQFPGLRAAAADTERIDQLLPASTRGIHGAALKNYLEQEGFSAYIFSGEITDLKHHFDKGRPLIVCLAPKGPRAPLHYAVLVGIDDSRVWLNDSARGKLFNEDLARFKEEWSATGNWALLAVPRQFAP